MNSTNTNSNTHQKPTVELETSKGTIRLQLDAEKAPKTVENFLAYVQAGHYNDTIFHRVIKGFMIQGGGFTADMKQKPTNASIPNEANNGLKNEHYSVAMARTNDPHSASAQFFINSTNNDFLDFRAENAQGWGYAVFGKVIEGLDIVDAIEKVLTGRKGFHDDVPVENVTILSAKICDANAHAEANTSAAKA
jgi:peptidyl-prolyl cis-trans isomerase B (cyclophilin B)